MKCIITHLITNFYKTSIYPDITKISIISPNLYPDKDKYNLDLYRPINNLIILEKIKQEDMKQHMTKCLEENTIIWDNDHGNRQGQGKETVTPHKD